MGLMFDEKQLQVIRSAGCKSGRSLAALMSVWHRVCEVTEGMDFHMANTYVYPNGTIRVQGKLSSLPAILCANALHVECGGSIWSDDDGLCGVKLAWYREFYGKMRVENHVLDFILHREKLHEQA